MGTTYILAKNQPACWRVSVVDYMDMVWAYVKATPIWDNHRGLLRPNSSNSNYSYSDEIAACLRHLDHIINNGNDRPVY